MRWSAPSALIAAVACGGGSPVGPSTLPPAQAAEATPVAPEPAAASAEDPASSPTGAEGAAAAEPVNVQLQSFDYVWQKIADTYWDPNMGGRDWAGVRAELRPRAAAATDSAQVRAVIGEMLGRLGESHFAVFPGESLDAIKGNDKESNGPERHAAGEGAIGIDLRVVDGAALITRVRPGSPAAEKKLATGWQIVAVDGVEVAAQLAKVTAGMAGNPMVDYYATAAVHGRITGDAGTEVELTLRDKRDRTVTHRFARAEPHGTKVQFGHLPAMYVTYDSRTIGRDVGYIAFSAWFDPATVTAGFTRDLEQFAKTRGVVIDLRGNPGGIGGMAAGMAGYLVDKAGLSLGTMTTRASQFKFVISPQAHHYAGKIAILIDGLSASTSEIFAGGMADIGRARIFGARSPGAALPSVIEKLPNGDGFQFAIADYVSASGARLEGAGVTPDVVTPLTRRALLAGKDPALDAAVAWIRSKEGVR